ncbi:MAG: hypothetical protein AB4426_02280 [Xenococcaceae cyanobacterium]
MQLQKKIYFLKRILNGKTRYFLQLINEGLPYQKPHRTIGNQKIGVDINLSIVECHEVKGDRYLALLIKEKIEFEKTYMLSA